MQKAIAKLNNLAPDAAQAGLTRCCGASRWVTRMLDRRPFANRCQLLQSADEVWWNLTADDWREAFAQHPKIGDLEQARARFATTHDWSAQEQSGVQQVPESMLADLAAGNQAYLAKFGYIFIVCATGKGAVEMLHLLRQRLTHDPHTELPIAAEEQRKITQLRLEKWLDELNGDNGN